MSIGNFFIRLATSLEPALLRTRVGQLETELAHVRAELETVKHQRDKLQHECDRLVRNALRRDKRRGPRKAKP